MWGSVMGTRAGNECTVTGIGGWAWLLPLVVPLVCPAFAALLSGASPAAARDRGLLHLFFLLGLALARALPVFIARCLGFSFHQRVAQCSFHAGAGLAEGDQRAGPGLDRNFGDLPVFSAVRTTWALVILPRILAMRSIPSSANVRSGWVIATCLPVHSTGMLRLLRDSAAHKMRGSLRCSPSC